MSWTVIIPNKAVQAEIDALAGDLQATFYGMLSTIEANGLAALPPPAVKHLENRLWELRLRARSGIARAVYMTMVERRVVVLHVFTKKTQSTPPRHLETARRRMRNIGRSA